MPTGITIEELVVKLAYDVAELNKAKEETAKLKEETKKVGPAADESFDKATKAARSFGDAAKAAAESAKSAISGVAGALKSGITGIIDARKSALEFGDKNAERLDKVAKAARKTGVSGEDLQRLQFAAKQGGASEKDIVGAVGKLNKGLADIEIGGGKGTQKGLKLLALDAKDLIPLSAPERLKLIADRLRLIDSESERSTILQRLFGGKGSSLASLLSDTEDFTKTLGQASVVSNAHLAATEKLSDAYGLQKNQIQGLKDRLFTAAIPALQATVDSSNAWIAANKEWIGQKIDQAVKLASDAYLVANDEVKKLGKEFGAWLEQNKEWVRAEIPKQIKNTADAMRGLVTVLREGVAAYQDFRVGLKVIGEVGTGETAITDVGKRVQELKERKAFQGFADQITAKRNRDYRNARAVDEDAFEKEYDANYQKVVKQLAERKAAAQKVADDAIKAKQAANKKQLFLDAQKKPKKVKPVSSYTYEELEEALLSGQPTQAVQKGSLSTPKAEAIKPTVAISFYAFDLKQYIYTSDPVKAGQTAADGVQKEFQAGTKRFAPITNLAR